MACFMNLYHAAAAACLSSQEELSPMQVISTKGSSPVAYPEPSARFLPVPQISDSMSVTVENELTVILKTLIDANGRDVHSTRRTRAIY